MPGRWEDDRCYGFWFFLLLLIGWYAYVSSVVASIACRVIAEVGFWMRHRWWHWLLGKDALLVLLLDHNLVSGYILALNILDTGREMVGRTYVQRCHLLCWIGCITHPPLLIFRFLRDRGDP